MFGKKDKNITETPAVPKEAQSWDDKLLSALPQKATYFNSVRTHAYENRNLVANYIEFWAALQVDQSQDKWRVMHYMIFDLDQPDGNFKANIVSKEDVSFPEAIYHVSKFACMASVMETREPIDLTIEKYPAETYPELKVHFFDLPYYKDAANIEGMAFDTAGHPYRRVEGKVISTTVFERSELAKSVLAVERARDNPKVAAKIEGGILSDIFNSASEPNTSLDNILKVGHVLACLDEFTALVGAFYLDVQNTVSKNDKFEKIQSLTAEEKKDLYSKASSRLDGSVLLKANGQLDQAQTLGAHVEPFRKFVAECELYSHLLNASQNLKNLKQSFSSVGGTNLDLITNIKRSVDSAESKFMDLGGSREQVDKLRAWVANPKKDEIPQWLPGFIERYYDQRHKLMKKIQERQAGAREVNTMSVKVKPPIIE